MQLIFTFLLIRYFIKNKNTELKNKTLRFQRILDNSPIGYFFVAIDRKIQYVNPAWEKMHGYKLSEIKGKRYDFLVTDESSAEVEKLLKRILLGETLTGEFDRLLKNGTVGYHNYYVQPVYSKSEIIGFEGFMVDIIELKNKEQQLIKAHEQLLSIFDSIDEPIYISDPIDYKIKYHNSATKEVIGNCVNQKCYEAFHNRNSPCDFCTNDKIFGKNIGKTYIWDFYHKKNERYYKCIDRAIKWSDGKYVRCEIAIDKTSFKNTFSKLAKANQELHLLAEKTNIRIEEEKKKLSRYIHDRLGQLFTLMKLKLTSLSKHDDIDEICIEEIDNLISMTDKGIEIARNISRKLRPSILDNLGLKEAIIDYLTNFSELSDIVCHYTFQPEDFSVDKELSINIYRIINELFTNIIRHSQADHVSFDFNCSKNDLLLIVEDNGVGIPTEKIISSKSLGLIGIRERLRPWNGNMVIGNKSSKGTRIEIRLPNYNSNNYKDLL